MNQEIIHKIRWLQQAEGHSPCFRTDKIFCSYQNKCCWADICDLEISKNKIKPLIKFEVKE